MKTFLFRSPSQIGQSGREGVACQSQDHAISVISSNNLDSGVPSTGCYQRIVCHHQVEPVPYARHRPGLNSTERITTRSYTVQTQQHQE